MQRIIFEKALRVKYDLDMLGSRGLARQRHWPEQR